MSSRHSLGAVVSISGGAPTSALGHGSQWTRRRRPDLNQSSPGLTSTSRLDNLSVSRLGCVSMSPSATRS